MADDLATWLRECITQDLAVASEQRRFEQYVEGTGRMFSVTHAIVSMAPHRAVAELDAKLRIVEHHHVDDYPFGEPHNPPLCSVCENEGWPCPTLRLIALPYADWTGYRVEWKP